MAVFPATPLPIFPYTLKQRWNTIITKLDGQNEQRMQKALYPQYDVTLTFDVMSKSEFKTLWDFYHARRGRFEKFWFYTYETDEWPVHYVGTGDGETTIFDLPGKVTSSRTLYVDDVEQTSGFSYLTGGGDGDADRVQFDSAPSAGEVVTASFTGYLRCPVRFDDDTMDRELFSAALYSTGLKCKGLRPD